jgi:hypothetical protein
MAEAFLLLLAAGIMLAVAVPNPRDLTLNWLRLGGIIALAMVGIAGYFATKRTGWDRHQFETFGSIAALILFQLAFVQLAFPTIGRLAAVSAFIAGIWIAVLNSLGKTSTAYAFTTLATSIGVAAMVGSVLMTMLLGHAYLTASKMTIRPFRRLSGWLIAVLLLRAACAVALALWMNRIYQVKSLWPIHGFLILTRWAVGLLIPFVFVLMAHDCIRRRSTQSATGILYVAGVLIFIGELLALHLARETGLPF